VGEGSDERRKLWHSPALQLVKDFLNTSPQQFVGIRPHMLLAYVLTHAAFHNNEALESRPAAHASWPQVSMSIPSDPLN
jgi:hypothetical protein